MPDGQLEEGSLLNERYRIIRVIGRGGMGTVYRAEHEQLNAVVAIKEIRSALATGTPEQVTMEQYQQEARFLVRLNHPNLPKVTDAFVDGDRFYLVMDFVEGATLDACLRMLGGKPIDPVTVVNLAIEMAEVLRYLHSQNPPIIFRDLKPSNVMVQPDRHIKLIDFGIARRFQPGASKDTSLLGSIGYSPPEQFGRHQTDKRSDIYALGATMHHLLTARDPSISPFKFIPVEQVNGSIPNSLSRLVSTCVAMDPDMRPSDAGVVGAELLSIRDVLNRVVPPLAAVSSQVNAAISTGVSTVGTGSNAWMPVPQGVYSGYDGPARRTARNLTRLRYPVIALGVVMFAVTAVSLDSGARHSSVKKHPSRSTSHMASNHRFRGSSSSSSKSGGDYSSFSGDITGEGNTNNPSSGESNQQSDDSDGSRTGMAQCSAEVLGPSPDGKSLRLHITGEINGKKDASGSVAAYFYKSDKTPLRSRDPKGSYATPSGQLFAEYTFQIDEDSKSIDELIDVPMDQFSSTNNILFKCIIYADKKSEGQTDLIPYTEETPSTSNSSES